MKILAIETSCDDTGIAILEVKRGKTPVFTVLSNIIASQIKVHQKYGGVYPMMAKREHQKNLLPALTKSLKESELLKSQITNSNLQANPKSQIINTILEREPELLKKIIPFLKKYKKPDVDLIAVTNGPGLEPCLWVGINFAKALSSFWDIPVVPVNHIESHILASCLENQKSEFPAVALVVSGGHTQLILVKKIGNYKILGETRDDAAGECFDKSAKILGLGYPGGPVIAKLAKLAETRSPLISGERVSAQLPRPMINTKDYDFSFSGLKTAVLYHHKKQVWLNSHDRRKLTTLKIKQYRQEMAVEIQQAVIDVLLKKTIKAAKDYKAKTIILGGGVSANQELRKQFKEAIENKLAAFLSIDKNAATIYFLVPPANLSTDNAVMTAITGYFHRNKKIARPEFVKLRANANLRISK
ncbi:MAG: hypothetical protein A3G45_01080 [Candidatus Staskawiczbacteria bacterium RIFCSPLOWO2_12_FULL_37_15]|uniref:tRNA N6-adenosine threonylcarbamoyltransferase n=1 Tax=Candidatus Staskawiczbacteria bacterium RIFCSPLOWO2_12_FULL_37_15 TaxID=1802218 RepID=A0A1G2ILW5_9BACT|nr:MAG: hypothetical protein A3G45_01080 [Candidatus Staskawiczbacteria bacterium RIFCSPLOWO2_12_FULL_37_15]